MSISPWDVVRVPFPYTERPIVQRRPAVVIASPATPLGETLLWVLMVTSAENRPWPGDVPVSDLAVAGLPVPSVVRVAKIATITQADATVLGSLVAPDRIGVRRAIAAWLGITD